MPTEQRTTSTGKIGGKIGGGGKAPVEEVVEEAPKKKGRKKLLLILVAVVVLVLGAGAYVFLLAPGGEEEGAEGGEHAAEEVVQEPGDVLTVDAVSINLAEGHYLRLGLGLQFVLGAGAHGEPDPSKALDKAIALYSGRPMAEVNDPTHREELKAELLHQLEEAYHHEVMDVYLTTYVTQ
ncbi:flagellar basal body-associated FliL family protein [Cellulomonas endophytica]|uniref:flagellar basal body-associated FliL family protein n=1 Tax=Cellulomonas endophytica TaxID=2494735 RepID=UPI0010123E80|nr:flagellar basal body-associated FliL family protein [Cellulomonas endophytica]